MAQLVLEGEGSNYGLQVQISYIKKMFHENACILNTSTAINSQNMNTSKVSKRCRIS